MREQRPLFLPWSLLAVVCCALMWMAPGEETIPYHLAWIGFALAYGFDPWSPRRTAWSLVLYTAVTGGILVTRAASGVIAWEETAEIPLMCLLVALMVWHVRRRLAALATATVLARQDRELARQREHLTRLTSHEMRTPITIARGFVELLLAKDRDPERRADLEVVNDELGRLTRASERLVRVIRLQDAPRCALVEVDALVCQTAERWAAVAERVWVVQAHGGVFECAAERLRAALDTLIENALRYTQDGDLVRVFCSRRGGVLEIGVADSGPGMHEELIMLINEERGAAVPLAAGDAPRDELSQTGLGLGLVRAVVEARQGRLVVGKAPEGGALATMSFPLAVSVPQAVTDIRRGLLASDVPA